MVGPIVLVLRGPLTELTPSTPCGGALDLIAIAIVRAWPELHVGQLFAALQFLGITLAFGCFAELADRATGHSPVALATAVTLGVSQLFTVAFAPPWAATAFGTCAGAALAVHGCLGRRSPTGVAAIGASTALLLAASFVPAWTAACVLAAFAVVWRSLAASATGTRLTVSLSAAVSVALIPLLILKEVSASVIVSAEPWTRCLASRTALTSVAPFGEAIDVTGPLVLALAALGLYTAALQAGARRTVVLTVLLALAIFPAAGARWPSAVILAPVLVAIWCLAGNGLLEICALASSRRRHLFLALLLTAVPLLQLSRVHARERDDKLSRIGHERASLGQIRNLLNLLPAGSTLVEEDASVDLLLRAAVFGGHRSSKPLAIVPLTRQGVLDALKTRQVFAFPSGQRELSLRGFVVEAMADPTGAGGRDLRGLATISATRTCAQLGRAWADLAGVGVNGRVSLSADSELAEGPVVVYFNGTNGYTPGPDGWPPRVMHGFGLRMFERRTPEESARLDAEAVDAGLQGHATFASPYVARLTLYRTPGAPLVLPIVLGPPRSQGVGRLLADDGDALPLTLCDAPNVAISTF